MKKLVLDSRVKRAVSRAPASGQSGASAVANFSQEVDRARAYLAANRSQFSVRSAKARLALSGSDVTLMVGPVPRQD